MTSTLVYSRPPSAPGAEPVLGVALVGAEVGGGVVKAVRLSSLAGQLELRGKAFVVATGA